MSKGPSWSPSNQISNSNEQEVTDPRQAKYESYLPKGQAGIQVFFEPCKGQTTFWNQDHAAVREEYGTGTQVGWSAFHKLSGSVGAHVPFYPRPPWWFTMET